MNRKPGDWDCRSCQHLNFSRRDLCQRCSEPRSAADRGSVGGALGGDYANFGGRVGGGSSFGTGFGAGSDVRPGDWYCTCGAHNFASRSSCFKCAAFKEEAAVNGGAGGFDGDMSRSRGFGFGAVGALASALSVAWAPAWEPARPVVVPAALAGSLATGFAPGLDATSTTSPAGRSASGATHRGTPALRCRKAMAAAMSRSSKGCPCPAIVIIIIIRRK
ncbi:Uncharacterized RNA-binding protein C17H9.04c [Triticum urartu]|uniref:Uncharacterized RNA-binding protein C17H9.04c n=1 Tax=Triticum urartu TaxID=4572 RepID=M8A6A4_TRIUA|nr:Uncharacterized RNA-binding protein C17H9.04c [Triticum urartu]